MPRAVWACTATVKRPPGAVCHSWANVQRHACVIVVRGVVGRGRTLLEEDVGVGDAPRRRGSEQPAELDDARAAAFQEQRDLCGVPCVRATTLLER